MFATRRSIAGGSGNASRARYPVSPARRSNVEHVAHRRHREIATRQVAARAPVSPGNPAAPKSRTTACTGCVGTPGRWVGRESASGARPGANSDATRHLTFEAFRSRTGCRGAAPPAVRTGTPGYADRALRPRPVARRGCVHRERNRCRGSGTEWTRGGQEWGTSRSVPRSGPSCSSRTNGGARHRVRGGDLNGYRFMVALPASCRIRVVITGAVG